MLAILIMLFGLGLVIFVHELGHLITAKKTGIGVYEFSIGFGPKITGFKFKGTKYSIRIIPFGGFIKLAGMDEEGDITKCSPEENYYSKPVLSRILTIGSGPFMNVFFAFLIFVLVFSVIGIPKAINVVDEVFDETPAYKTGMKKGDQIIALNGREIIDMESDGIKPILRSGGKEIQLVVKRGDEIFDIKIKPKFDEKKNVSLIGIKLESEITRQNPIMAIYYGVLETYYQTRLTLRGLGMVVSGKAALKDMIGPVGIVQVASHQVRRGIVAFLQLLSLISINLGILNILPFPVLDGGHLIFLIVEAIRRKPVNRTIENMINALGVIIIIMFMFLIVLNDIMRWMERSEMLNNLEKANIITPDK